MPLELPSLKTVPEIDVGWRFPKLYPAPFCEAPLGMTTLLIASEAAAKKHGIDHDDASTGRSLESLYPEIRFYPDKLEFRSDEADQKHIIGYASVFGAVVRHP